MSIYRIEDIDHTERYVDFIIQHIEGRSLRKVLITYICIVTFLLSFNLLWCNSFQLTTDFQIRKLGAERNKIIWKLEREKRENGERGKVE